MTAVEIDSAKKSRISYLSILLLCIVTLVLFRYFTLYNTATDLFFDEAQYWAWSQKMDFGYYSKPPFLAWSIRAATEICGHGEACVRAASPLFHSLSSLFIFFAGRAIYGEKTGFWASLTFLTIPGISFSSGLISTDVPLLTFWTLALWAFVEFQKSQSWGWAILLGVAIGFGLLSKYAMAFFVLCAALYIWESKRARWMVFSGKLWAALAIAAVILSPNIIWNLQNGLVTFSHTADNANWSRSFGNLDKALEFFAAQFGVFGPILFAVLLLAMFNFYRFRSYPEHQKALNDDDRMLLTFSIPVILIITMQAFLSRAHANWAATAYPAAAILVIGLLIRYQNWMVIRISFIIHIIAIALLSVGVMTAGKVAAPTKTEPFFRVLGWENIAVETRKLLEGGNYTGVLTHRRDMAAEMNYYLRNAPTPVMAWKTGKYPRDYFQMTIPFPKALPEDSFLLVSETPKPRKILRYFAVVEEIGVKQIPAGMTQSRTVYFYKLSGYKGP